MKGIGWSDKTELLLKLALIKVVVVSRVELGKTHLPYVRGLQILWIKSPRWQGCKNILSSPTLNIAT